MAPLDPIAHLDLYGYCLIEDAISTAQADQMVETYFRLHNDPAHRSAMHCSADDLYQTLFGLANLDQQCWECAAHPQVLAVVRHFLGPDARIGEICSKWVKPGAAGGGVHVDSSRDLPLPLPETPWLINSMWMITDFTVENGATLVAPFSHRSRRRPPQDVGPEDRRLYPLSGRRGSVLLWHGGVWHANGANSTRDQHRMGLNISYSPPWWNLMREGGHQPIRAELFAQMPPEMQKLNQHRVGSSRSEIYELA